MEPQKNKNKKRTPRPGTILIVLGCLVLLGSLGLYLKIQIDDRVAAMRAAEALEKITWRLADAAEQKPSAGAEAEMPSPEESTPAVQKHDAQGETESDADSARPENILLIDGLDYLGYLDFPGHDRTLPVLADFDFDLLSYGPARYSGSLYANDLVIAGHNNNSHFSVLHALQPGEKVVFTDGLGNVIRYQVIGKEYMDDEEVETMLTGDWDLTLFTCSTTDGVGRVAIRCKRAA